LTDLRDSLDAVENINLCLESQFTGHPSHSLAPVLTELSRLSIGLLYVPLCPETRYWWCINSYQFTSADKMIVSRHTHTHTHTGSAKKGLAYKAECLCTVAYVDTGSSYVTYNTCSASDCRLGNPPCVCTMYVILVPVSEPGYFVASWCRTPLRHPPKVTIDQ
jgi:hypothetical protein